MNINERVEYFLNNKKYNQRTNMCEMFKKHKSDKSTYHNYTTFYNFLFSEFVNKKINFFELGLGTNNLDVPSNMGSNGTPGASLYAFREYFDNANICGADVDTRILFEDEKIWTFYVDQKNSDDIKNLWNNFENTEFDVMIDDGLHEYSANITFFENSFHMLKKDGIYIIEDVLNSDEQKFIDYFSKFECAYSNVIDLPIDQEWADNYFDGTLNTCDNRIVLIIK